MAAKTLSLTALAAAVGRSQPVLSRWTKDPRWPFGRGPWRAKVVPDVKQWAAQNLAPQRGAGEVEPPSPGAKSKLDLEIELLAERIAEKKISRGLKLGGLVSKKDIEAREVRQMRVILEGYMSAKALAVTMEGMDVLQREVLLENWARDRYSKVLNAREDNDGEGAGAAPAAKAG